MKNKYSDKFNLYSFNPLIIIELTGNLHFEGVVMCFLGLAFYVGVKNRKSLVLSSFLFACAVCVKMLPLIFIPLIIRKLGWKKGFTYTVLVGMFTALFFSAISRPNAHREALFKCKSLLSEV